MFSRSVLYNSLWPRRLACQAPLSMAFPRQEYWSGLPFPSPGIFPTQGLNPSPASALLAVRYHQYHLRSPLSRWAQLTTWALKDEADQSNRKDGVEEASPTKETKGEVRTWTLTCLTVAVLEEVGPEPWTKECQWPCADRQWGDRGLCPAAPRGWISLAAWTRKGFLPTSLREGTQPCPYLGFSLVRPVLILTYRNYEIINLCCLKPLNLWSFFNGRKCVESIITQLYPSLCDSRDCSLPGSSVHGILQPRILEGVAMPSSRGSSGARNGTHISHIVGRFFSLSTREAYYGRIRKMPIMAEFR